MLLRYASALSAASATNKVAGASAQLIGVNAGRSGLTVALDSASTDHVYLLLGAGTASATNFHIALSAAQPVWNGVIGGAQWNGAVQFFGAGGVLSVIEV